MMTIYSPWSALEGMQSLTQYTPEQIETFAGRLFDTIDEERLLTDYCFIQDCINVLEGIRKAVRPTINQIVLNQAKAFEIGGYKFTYRTQSKYNYSECSMWKEASESVKLQLDYQKQIEDILKRGGSIGGVKLEKVSVNVVDNFAMSKSKPF